VVPSVSGPEESGAAASELIVSDPATSTDESEHEVARSSTPAARVAATDERMGAG
jgi:hypothetical protein